MAPQQPVVAIIVPTFQRCCKYDALFFTNRRQAILCLHLRACRGTIEFNAPSHTLPPLNTEDPSKCVSGAEYSRTHSTLCKQVLCVNKVKWNTDSTSEVTFFRLPVRTTYMLTHATRLPSQIKRDV